MNKLYKWAKEIESEINQVKLKQSQAVLQKMYTKPSRNACLIQATSEKKTIKNLTPTRKSTELHVTFSIS